MRLFRLIIKLIIKLQMGFWYARYYARPFWKKWKPQLLALLKHPAISGASRTLALGFVLVAFVGGIGWVAAMSISMVHRTTGEQAPPCIWKASNGTMLPNTMGHQLLEVDVMQGADPKVFQDFNDILLKAESILENKDSITFAPNQYETFYDKEPHFTQHQAISILSSIRQATRQCGFRFCDSQLLFSDAIRTRKIDCDTSAYLYISIGRLYNLPIKPVAVPRHMFVRFYLDRTHYLNLNTNGYLFPETDRVFIRTFKPSISFVNEGIYMKSMGYRETIAQYYAYVGLLGKRKPGESLQQHFFPFLRKALHEDPENPYALHFARLFGFPPGEGTPPYGLAPAEVKKKTR